NQLTDLHAAELSKSLEAEKQIKFFQSSVAVAFSERDNAIMAEQTNEKEKSASQKVDFMQQKQTALEEEVEALRKSVCSEEKMKSDTSDLRSYHSQHRMDIMNLLEKEASQFKSVVDDVKEYMRQICVNEELKYVSL
nr:hypothetical protein [Tanacetum cinerariifolium]